MANGRLIPEDALSFWTNLGKHSLFIWLYVCRMKTGPRRIIHVDELSSVVKGYLLNVGCVALIPEWSKLQCWQIPKSWQVIKDYVLNASVVRRSSRTTEDSSSRRIMRLMPVFTLETYNQTNNEYLPVQVRPDG